MEGYFTGILDLYTAKMTGEDTSAAKPTYAKPEVLAKSIEVEIAPVYKEGKMYASNAKTRDTRRIDGYNVKINPDKVPISKLAVLLGRQTDAKGVQLIKGSNQPAQVALGFACTLDDGSKELWWLYKGEFAEITKKAKTEGENIEYQTPELTGAFVRRIHDDLLAAVVDTSVEGVDPTVAAGWFTAVYDTTAE